jgi:recombination protein RecA
MSFKTPSFMSKLIKDQKAVVASAMKQKPLITTGSVSLDWATGGGVPKGELTVLWGAEGSGKSWLSAKIMAEELRKRPDAYAIYIDTEFSYDSKRMENLGVDTDRVFVFQGNTYEAIVSPIGKMEADVFEDNRLCFVCVDSIKAMTTVNEQKQMVDGNIESASNAYGGIAKCINPLLRILSRWAHKLELPVVLVNHVNSNLETMTAKYEPHIMGGGHFLKHMMSTCVYLGKVKSKDSKLVDTEHKNINGTDIVSGYLIRAKVNKSRRTVEGKSAEFSVDFTSGTIEKKESELTRLASSLGIVNKEGQSLYYGDVNGTDKARYESGFITLLEKKPELYDKIYKEVMENSKKTVFKPSADDLSDKEIEVLLAD